MGLPEKVFKAGKLVFERTFEKELVNDKYLPQEAFDNCLERAKAGLSPAIAEMEKCLALSIALHRKGEHGEDVDKEIETLAASMDPENVKEISSRGWWGG